MIKREKGRKDYEIGYYEGVVTNSDLWKFQTDGAPPLKLAIAERSFRGNFVWNFSPGVRVWCKMLGKEFFLEQGQSAKTVCEYCDFKGVCIGTNEPEIVDTDILLLNPAPERVAPSNAQSLVPFDPDEDILEEQDVQRREQEKRLP